MALNSMCASACSRTARPCGACMLRRFKMTRIDQFRPRGTARQADRFVEFEVRGACHAAFEHARRRARGPRRPWRPDRLRTMRRAPRCARNGPCARLGSGNPVNRGETDGAANIMANGSTRETAKEAQNGMAKEAVKQAATRRCRHKAAAVKHAPRRNRANGSPNSDRTNAPTAAPSGPTTQPFTILDSTIQRVRCAGEAGQSGEARRFGRFGARPARAATDQEETP